MKKFLVGIMGAAILFWGCPSVASAEGTEADAGFHPPGIWTWDNWFVQDGKKWHAFYLQLPKAVGLERRWKDNDFYKHVGHATSTDLKSWLDEGPALCALSHTWNDRHIATGSVVRHDGRWWMVFTGRGTRADGVGLAVSDDLTNWRPAQDKALFGLTSTWGASAESGVFASDWEGQTHRWVGISDPYVLPEPVDGWYVMVLCSRVLDEPLAESGCLTLLRSRDLRHWEMPQILAWPGCFERMETPQLWKRHEHWHLTFGGVLEKTWLKTDAASLPAAVRDQHSHQNYGYAMAALTGPAQESKLQHIAVPKGHYIMKVLPLTADQDVAILTVANKNDSGISPAYPLQYTRDGLLKLTLPEKAQ